MVSLEHNTHNVFRTACSPNHLHLLDWCISAATTNSWIFMQPGYQIIFASISSMAVLESLLIVTLAPANSSTDAVWDEGALTLARREAAQHHGSKMSCSEQSGKQSIKIIIFKYLVFWIDRTDTHHICITYNWMNNLSIPLYYLFRNNPQMQLFLLVAIFKSD